MNKKTWDTMVASIWRRRLFVLPILLLLVMLQQYAVAVILLASIYMLALPFPRTGLVTRFALTATLLISLNSVVGFFTWALKVPFTLELGIWLYALGAALLLLKARSPTLSKHFPKEDMVALTGAIICMSVLLWPLVARHDSVGFIRTIGRGVDNIAHLSLIRSIEVHGNYLEGFGPAKDQEMLKNITAYPQGFHLNATLFNQVLSPVEPGQPHTVRQSLVLFMVVIVLGYGLLFYLFIYGSLYFCRRFVSKRIGILASFVSIVLASVLFLATLFGMYAFGFQAQICALALFMAFLIVMFEYEEAESKQKQRLYLMMAALLSAGIGFVYLYAWPLAFGVLCLLVGRLIKQRFVFRRSTAVLLSGLMLINWAPAFLYLRYSDKGLKLDEIGGAVVLNGFVLISLYLLCELYLHKKRSRNPELARMIKTALRVSALFAIAIYFYQKLTIGGEARYYFFKATYPIAIIIGLISVSLTVAGLHKLTKWRYRLFGYAMLIGIFCISSASLIGYLKKPFVFSERHAALAIRMGNSPKFLNESTKVISIGNNNEDADDIRFMRFLGAFAGKGNAAVEEIGLYSFWAFQRQHVYELIKAYQLQQPDKKLYIVTGDKRSKAAFAQPGPHSAGLIIIDPNTSDPLEGLCPDIPCSY